MKLKDFIGNFESVKRITAWLNDYYTGATYRHYCILYGPSGCGKTTLGEILAEEYKLDILHITPSDINNKDDMNNFIKSVNIRPLYSKHKLILIDDINEYRHPYKKKLCEIGVEGKSIHPILYTSRNLSSFSPPEFTKNGLKIKLLRPLTREIYKHLLTLNSNLPDDVLKKIAYESRSVRSAVLSLYNSSVNELIYPIQTKYEKLKDIKQRNLKDDLDPSMIWYVFNSIRGYDANALKVMNRFANFDWMINKYRAITQYPQDNIDPFFVNNMIEPIEKVKLEYRYIQPKFKISHKDEKSIKTAPKKNEVKETTTKQSAIDQWM